MPWTTPATVIAGQLMTAAFWNTHVRDNSAFLYLSAPRAAEYDNGTSGTAKTLDFSANGPLQKVTRNGNCTFTLTAPSVPSTVLVRFIHDATGTTYTVAFSPAVKWPSGSAPTFTNTANAVDIVSLYWDGAAWWGVATTNCS